MAFYCNGKKDICECDILCADCQHYDNTGGKKWQTNADRIRAMSDEELAKIIKTIAFDVYNCNEGQNKSMKMVKGRCMCEFNCDECILELLKQPAEGE